MQRRSPKRECARATQALLVIATPAIVSSTLGNANPTILVGAYGVSLAIVWAVVLVVVFVALRPSLPRAAPRRATPSGTARTK